MAEKNKEREYPIYKELGEAYDYYNKELFGDVLPRCIIVLSKNERNFGHFMPLNYISVKDGKEVHEIALNITMFAVREIKLTLSTLVHEICHLKTFEDGNYGRGCYHNKVWANLMESIGLIPSSTGKEGGKRIGQHVSHYIENGGLFDKKTKILLNKGYLIPFVEKVRTEIKSYTEEEAEKIAIPAKPGFYLDNEGNEFEGKTIVCGGDKDGKDIVKIIVKEKQKRAVYTCSCGNRLWGRTGLDIRCNDCKRNFKELNKEEGVMQKKKLNTRRKSR